MNVANPMVRVRVLQANIEVVDDLSTGGTSRSGSRRTSGYDRCVAHGSPAYAVYHVGRERQHSRKVPLGSMVCGYYLFFVLLHKGKTIPQHLVV